MKPMLLVLFMILSLRTFAGQSTSLGALISCVENTLSDYRPGVSQSEMWSSSPDFAPLSSDIAFCKGYVSKVKETQLPPLVQENVKSAFLERSSNYRCNNISRCVYSVGHEYSFTYDLAETAYDFNVAGRKLYLVIYHGYGGEWGREESREHYMLVDPRGDIKVKNTLFFR